MLRQLPASLRARFSLRFLTSARRSLATSSGSSKGEKAEDEQFKKDTFGIPWEDCNKIDQEVEEAQVQGKMHLENEKVQIEQLKEQLFGKV